MNRKSLIALVVAAVGMPLSAQLVWKERKIDFGIVQESEGKATRYFECRNDGDTSVKIDRIRTTCGCTSAVSAGEVVAPGASIKMPVTYNPAGRPGHFDKGVYVYAADSVYKLGISGNVMPSAQTLSLRYPEKVGILRMSRKEVLLGDVRVGATRSRSISGFNMSGKPVVLKYVGKDKNISAGVYPDTIAGGGMVNISVIYKTTDNAEIGRHEYLLKFMLNDSVVNIPAIVNVVESGFTPVDLKKSPQAVVNARRLDMGNMRKMQSAKKMLEVRNVGKSDLQLRRIAATGKAVSVKAELPAVVKPGKAMKISVAVDRSQLTDSVLNERVIISTNDPAEPEMTVRVVGTK